MRRVFATGEEKNNTRTERRTSVEINLLGMPCRKLPVVTEL